MEDFPSIEEVHEILDKISEELPKEFFQELNEGIVLLPQIKMHPKSRKESPLYIMGEYSRSYTGRNIKIYYGSFKRVYRNASRKTVYRELEETLLHEFTHHIESLAGEKGLEIKDKQNMNRYENKD